MNAKQKYVDVLTKEKPDLIEVLFEFEANVHPKIDGKVTVKELYLLDV